MTDYSNILKAVQGQQEKLTSAQQADNYGTFSNLMKEGVYLPDLLAKVQKVDVLEKKLAEMDRKPSVDEDLFAVMESAVKSDAEVKAAYQRRQDAKTAAISRLCLSDPVYKAADDEYRQTVHRAYVAKKGERSSRVQTFSDFHFVIAYKKPARLSLNPSAPTAVYGRGERSHDRAFRTYCLDAQGHRRRRGRTAQTER